MRLSIDTVQFVLIFVILQSNYTTNNPEDCRCVSIFWCYEDSHVDHVDKNIDTRFGERIVERKREDCESPVEICCDPEHIIPPTKRVIAISCGYRSFDGIDSSMESTSHYRAKFGEFPWMIAVLHNRPDKQDEYICDGSLIHRKVVLTAAHCVYGIPVNRIKIRAGEWDTQSTDESLPHQDRAIENVLIHGNYSSRLFRNDIALLILSRSLDITGNVNIICLPETISEFETNECVTSGWSRNKLDGPYERIMKKMELQIISNDICQHELHQARLEKKIVLDESFICADDVYENSMWKGDGGSPFVCPLNTDSNRFVQIGVAVQNIGRSIRIPNIFANVLNARSWIDEQLLFYNLDNTEYQYGNNASESVDYL